MSGHYDEAEEEEKSAEAKAEEARTLVAVDQELPLRHGGLRVDAAARRKDNEDTRGKTDHALDKKSPRP